MLHGWALNRVKPYVTQLCVKLYVTRLRGAILERKKMIKRWILDKLSIVFTYAQFYAFNYKIIITLL